MEQGHCGARLITGTSRRAHACHPFTDRGGVQPPTINCSVSALRFFFTMTLDRPDLSRRLVLARPASPGRRRTAEQVSANDSDGRYDEKP